MKKGRAVAGDDLRPEYDLRTLRVRRLGPGRRSFAGPIVEEVRRAREQHAAKYDYDFDVICEALRREQNASGRKVVSLPPKKPQPWVKAG